MDAPLRPGDTAPDAVLYRADGAPVATSELWRSGPVLLSFLRHSGCPFCKDTLARLRQEHPRIVDAGASVVAVLMGVPRSVGWFCDERGVPFECLADPDRSAYRAFGLAPGGLRRWLAHPRVLRAGAGALRRGIALGLPESGQDVRQMPGTFVVGRSGRVRFSHYGSHSADSPTMDVLLDALGA